MRLKSVYVEGVGIRVLPQADATPDERALLSRPINMFRSPLGAQPPSIAANCDEVSYDPITQLAKIAVRGRVYLVHASKCIMEQVDEPTVSNAIADVLSMPKRKSAKPKGQSDAVQE